MSKPLHCSIYRTANKLTAVLVLLTGTSLSSVALSAPNYSEANQRITRAITQSQAAQAEYRTGRNPNNPFAALNQVTAKGLGTQSNTFVWPHTQAHPNNTVINTPIPNPTTTDTNTAVKPHARAPKATAASATEQSSSAGGISGIPDNTKQNNNNGSPLHF